MFLPDGVTGKIEHVGNGKVAAAGPIVVVHLDPMGPLRHDPAQEICVRFAVSLLAHCVRPDRLPVSRIAPAAEGAEIHDGLQDPFSAETRAVGLDIRGKVRLRILRLVSVVLQADQVHLHQRKPRGKGSDSLRRVHRSAGLCEPKSDLRPVGDRHGRHHRLALLIQVHHLSQAHQAIVQPHLAAGGDTDAIADGSQGVGLRQAFRIKLLTRCFGQLFG